MLMLHRIIFAILYSVLAIIYLALSIYGFRLLKADWALGKLRGKESVIRLPIITASIGCICVMGSYILLVTFFSGVSATFAIENIEDDEKFIIGLLGLIIGGSLIFFSIIRITILNVQAMALAEAGIAATRKRWLILIGRYGALPLCLVVSTVGVLSLVISNFDIEMFIVSIIGTGFVTIVYFGFLFGYLSYTFRALAANLPSTNTEQQGIQNRCREIYRFTMIISICLFIYATACALATEMIIEKKFDIFFYLCLVNGLLFALVVYIIIRDLFLLTSRNEHNFLHKVPIKTPLLELTRIPTTPILPTSAGRSYLRSDSVQLTGIAITNKDQLSIGMAPHAPRPHGFPQMELGRQMSSQTVGPSHLRIGSGSSMHVWPQPHGVVWPRSKVKKK